MYNDNRIVMTLDAGGTNLVFSAIRGGNEIVTPITLPSCACNLEQCLGQLATGFSRIREQLTEAPVAISFAFPDQPIIRPVLSVICRTFLLSAEA